MLGVWSTPAKDEFCSGLLCKPLIANARGVEGGTLRLPGEVNRFAFSGCF